MSDNLLWVAIVATCVAALQVVALKLVDTHSADHRTRSSMLYAVQH